MSSRILVPIDLEHTETHREILRVAATSATGEGAKLTLLTVVEPPPVTVSQYLPARFEKQLHQAAAAELDRLAESMTIHSGSVDCTVRFGSVYKEILACAKAIGADLIVMGSHKPNVGDYLLGSNASRVVRHAACSVHIVRIRDTR